MLRTAPTVTTVVLWELSFFRLCDFRVVSHALRLSGSILVPQILTISTKTVDSMGKISSGALQPVMFNSCSALLLRSRDQDSSFDSCSSL